MISIKGMDDLFYISMKRANLQDCSTMLTIIYTWNSLLTKLPGEHQPSIPAQRAQVLPQQGKNISNMSGQRF